MSKVIVSPRIKLRMTKVLIAVEHGKGTIEDISSVTGIPPGQVDNDLHNLELTKRIKRTRGKFRLAEIQQDLFKVPRGTIKLSVQDTAKSDDLLEACLERKGYDLKKVKSLQDSIAEKLTMNIFTKQTEPLTRKEIALQEQIQDCLEKVYNKSRQLKFFSGLGISKQNDSLSPILGWVGGKTKLADRIIAMMPPHKVYVEPFLGGGSVFFKKPLADITIINDLDKDLMNFYKGVRDGSCDRIRQCKMPKNRKEFDKAVANKSKDICSYLGVNKKSYGSIMYDSHQHYIKKGRTIERFKSFCDRYRNKLKNTKILNKDFADLFNNYDSQDTLFYLDPPYVEAGKRLYKHGFCNPEQIAKLIKNIKGKIILSYDNHPNVRKAFKGLKINKINHSYSFNKPDGKKKVKELIITNF